VRPVPMSPTWTNGRSGDLAISKRLDRFFISESLVAKVDRFRLWHAIQKVSDHHPVCLQIDFGEKSLHRPFRFNSQWMDSPSYHRLVRDFWEKEQECNSWNAMDRISFKLRRLKLLSKEWAKEQDSFRSKELQSIEDDIERLYHRCPSGVFAEDDRALFENLSIKKNEILNIEEAAWRMKSRALWIKAGDNNTKFFHAFANQRRINNSIWELNDGSGNRISAQSDLEKAANSHFQRMFQDPGNCDIG